MTDRSQGPWPGATYRGFSGGGPARPRRSPARGAVYGGIAAAVAAGLLVGVFVRPNLGARAPTAEETGPAIPVEVAKVRPPPAPVATDRLEVLPADMADAARAEARLVPTAPPAPSREATASAQEPVLAPRATAPQERPSFNCARARSPAERMVCGDGRLARLDQRLDRAFRRAAASGVSFRELREDQDDWLRIREDAARYSPDAVASIYRQRIAELEEIAGPD